MHLRFTFLIIGVLSALAVEAQNIRDSVFQIREVGIVGNRIFKMEEAGKKETRIDSMAMMNKINSSLSELLAENSTIYIKDYGRGALATASFRGTAPTHTQVSWNGININSPMLGMVDFSLIPVYIIDEVSLQHGAASVSNQSGGLGGHISINNQVNWQNRISGKYYQGIGSYSTFDEYAQINIGNAKWQSKTRVYHNYSKNDYPFLNKHIPITDSIGGEIYHPTQKNKNANYKKYGIQQEIYFRPAEKWHTSAQVWYQNAGRGIPSVLSYEGSDSLILRENEQTDRTLKGVLQARYYGTKWKLKAHSGIDVQELDYELRVRNSGRVEVLKPVDSESDMWAWYNHVDANYTLSHQLLFAFSANANYYNIKTLDDVTKSGYEKSRFEYSLFAGAYYKPSKNWNVSAELRKDLITDISTPIIYNLGGSYKPIQEKNLVIKGSVARNFHNPTLNDLYWQPGGNPNLKPEEGQTYEAGIHWIGQLSNVEVESELTGYYSDVNDWILWLPNIKGYWEASNLQNVNAKGVELNVKGKYQLNKTLFSIQATYAYTRSINNGIGLGNDELAIGTQLPFIPVHAANALFSVSRGGYFLNYQYQYTGERNLLSSNYDTPDDEFPFYRLYQQHLNHLLFGKRFEFEQVALGVDLKVNNLFNEVYRSVLNRFMPGRNYCLVLKFEF